MASDPHQPTSVTSMTCAEMADVFSAYQDGELGSDQRRAAEVHLSSCVACRAMLADQQRIGSILRQTERGVVPAGLATRIGAGLDAVDREAHVMRSATPAAPIARRLGRPALGGYAGHLAAAAAACVVSVAATWGLMTSANQMGAVERDVLNAHIRSLLQDSPVQVASSDQHTVRPWFAGRADFAPPVNDLAAYGFPLLGGRLDYIAERRSGVLVYKRRLHVINVFMWPASGAGESAPRITTRNGYNVLSWTRGNVSYSAVSDVNADELRVLQRLL